MEGSEPEHTQILSIIGSRTDLVFTEKSFQKYGQVQRRHFVSPLTFSGFHGRLRVCLESHYVLPLIFLFLERRHYRSPYGTWPDFPTCLEVRLMTIFSDVTEKGFVKERYPHSTVKIWPIVCDNLETVWDSMEVSVIEGNAMGFPLVPKSVTFNDLESINQSINQLMLYYTVGQNVTVYTGRT